MTQLSVFLFILTCFAVNAFGCHSNAKNYVWNEVAKNAAFERGYGFPVFVTDGEMRALTPKGGWISRDGKNWTKTSLPDIGLNSAYQKFIQFKGAIYALGAMRGNYLKMKLSSKISRTRDFQTWETLAEKSNLPPRVFYGAAVFRDKIWLFGGFDGERYYNDVWNSADGVKWRRVAEKTAWTPRTAGVFEFKGKLWLFGGGVIDGEKSDNPNSRNEVWTSADGVKWTEVKINSPRLPNGTSVVFDDKLWFIGGNRNDGRFDSALFVSEDGLNWQSQSAPWTPRGAVAVWVYGDRLFMTGGKYSYREPNGEIKFVYSNDVWALSRR